MVLAARTVARAALLARVDLFRGLDRISLSRLAANLDPVFHPDGMAAWCKVFAMDPWIVIITLLATSTPWFVPAQLPAYQVGYEASEGRLFSHGQARLVCAGYMVVTLVALALCVPYWRALGLVR